MNFETWLKNRSDDYEKFFGDGRIKGKVEKAWEMYGGDLKFCNVLDKIFEKEKTFFMEALREAGKAALHFSETANSSAYATAISEIMAAVGHPVLGHGERINRINNALNRLNSALQNCA